MSEPTERAIKLRKKIKEAGISIEKAANLAEYTHPNGHKGISSTSLVAYLLGNTEMGVGKIDAIEAAIEKL